MRSVCLSVTRKLREMEDQMRGFDQSLKSKQASEEKVGATPLLPPVNHMLWGGVSISCQILLIYS